MKLLFEEVIIAEKNGISPAEDYTRIVLKVQRNGKEDIKTTQQAFEFLGESMQVVFLTGEDRIKLPGKE